MLLDAFLPDFDVRTHRSILIAGATSGRVYFACRIRLPSDAQALASRLLGSSDHGTSNMNEIRHLSPLAGRPAPKELLIVVTPSHNPPEDGGSPRDRDPFSGTAESESLLAVAIRYLLTHRPGWPSHGAIGKTLVSSGMIDRVVSDLRRPLSEVPVGFKWFVRGLLDGSYCFGGEESAGASFLRRDGTAWTTDKDGLIMDLLAAEITARTGHDPGEHYAELTATFGTPYYMRVDAPATPAQKAALRKLSPEAVTQSTLAGEPIVAKLTRAPGNGAAIDGLKVVTANGWFAARPSGTENIYKIYAESFKEQSHLQAIVSEAERLVTKAIESSHAQA